MDAILTERFGLQEQRFLTALSFSIEDEKQVFQSALKWTSRADEPALLACELSRSGDKWKLTYQTEGLEVLGQVLPRLKANDLLRVLDNIAEMVCELEQRAFYPPELLLIDFEHIYLDPVSLRPCFIYLPLKHVTKEDGVYEMIHRFCAEIKAVFADYPDAGRAYCEHLMSAVKRRREEQKRRLFFQPVRERTKKQPTIATTVVEGKRVRKKVGPAARTLVILVALFVGIGLRYQPFFELPFGHLIPFLIIVSGLVAFLVMGRKKRPEVDPASS